MPHPLESDQVGLFALGPGPVSLTNTRIYILLPKAFILKEFSAQYDSLYTDVIQEVAEDFGIFIYRADEVYKPGLILIDIVPGLIESEIIIAEISSQNPNVYYEFGYAHAIGKPTILLADRDSELPFDISGFRVIFIRYHNRWEERC